MTEAQRQDYYREFREQLDTTVAGRLGKRPLYYKIDILKGPVLVCMDGSVVEYDAGEKELLARIEHFRLKGGEPPVMPEELQELAAQLRGDDTEDLKQVLRRIKV